ncbi:uncharacterized protein TM35_000113330 [Trypanosoma theileri]|uniref:Uncharacterized protein n=1 Tax=Trypanosoma theileri TaxID=67003 RepID=A0A1X0NZZ9_9TRYP|nr:uncharacterized protein TM35_000113330 [Trypanosoma theileri]ORC89799.1 hypothetical protein TM35_000113330 [Trypanosoma theileri]
MFSFCRAWLAKPSTLLTFTLNEYLAGKSKSSSNNNNNNNNSSTSSSSSSTHPSGSHHPNSHVDPWATLTVTRRSLDEPWTLDVHQRKSSVYLNPLPAELLAGSVVAGHFLSSSTLPSPRAVRVVSVNGNPAISSGKVRREMNRSNTVVFQLVIHATFYRRALNKQRKEERDMGKEETELNNTAEEPLSAEFEDEHTAGDIDLVDPADELNDDNTVAVKSPSAADNKDDTTINSTTESVNVKETPAAAAVAHTTINSTTESVNSKQTPTVVDDVVGSSATLSPKDPDNSLGSSSADGVEKKKKKTSVESPARNGHKLTSQNQKSKKSKKGAAKTKKTAPKKKVNRVAASKADNFVGAVSISL